jgi:hypothetical protein
MKKLTIVFLGIAVLVGTLATARTLMLARNAFPDEGKYGDRFDHAIAGGRPFAVEEDLNWVNA